MTNEYRKMRPYYPRKRLSRVERQALILQKQQLKDWQHRLNGAIGAVIVLLKEGQREQAAHAIGKAKGEFLKLGAEMQKLADGMGEKFSRAVKGYLSSLNEILLSQPEWIDDAAIQHCYAATEKLDRELSAA